MLKVLTAERMREVDRLTTERYGIPSLLLMENAAHAVARVLSEKLGGSVAGKSILILCGKGNNGGDGAALARVLWTQGATVWVELFGKVQDTRGDAQRNFEILRDVTGTGGGGGALYFREEELEDIDGHLFDDWLARSNFDHTDVLVDALFGTGLNRPLEGFFDLQTGTLGNWKRNHSRPFIVSIDIPSGLGADSSTPLGANVDAHLTVTFTAPKTGNVIAPASRFNGDLIVADIGSPPILIDEQPSRLFVAQREDLEDWLSKAEFSTDSYKNKRGHALLIAGSTDYTGAAVLCGNAAIRSGVGLVTLAVPASCKGEIASRVLPEVILTGIAENENGGVSENAFAESEQLLSGVDAIAVGCGLSADDAGVEQLVQQIVKTRKTPVIIDAGALWFFSSLDGPAAKSDIEQPLILTPHEGEFMRLLGTDDKDALKDRVAAVRDFATKHDLILVLKGGRVLMGEPGGRVVVNPTGNAGLGKAGNGDTLTGILVGFVAQAVRMKIDIFETVVAAVYVAGLAGDIAERKYGKRVMTASDVRECLTEAFDSISND